MTRIGIIGGSGFDDPHLLDNIEIIKKHTPYGPTSDFVVTGSYQGIDLVILARHGKGHHIQPSAVNYRANVWAMKELGVSHILATTAVGSLREEIAQLKIEIDETKRKKHVSEITESEFFQDIQARAKDLRQKRE